MLLEASMVESIGSPFGGSLSTVEPEVVATMLLRKWVVVVSVA